MALSQINLNFDSKAMNYIVGARIANLSISDIEKISKELNLKDNATFRIKTSKGGKVPQI